MRIAIRIAGMVTLAFAPFSLPALSQVKIGTHTAEVKTIELPKGTTVEKLGPGHFKFKLPDKRIVEVREFNPRAGVIGLVRVIDPDPPYKPAEARTATKFGDPDPPPRAAAKIIDPNPPDKPIISAARARFVKSGTLTKIQVKNLPATDYIVIDDEITWLPAKITFSEPIKP